MKSMSTFECNERLSQACFKAEATPLAVLNSDPSGLGGYIVWLDGRTMLRNKYATLSNQQREPSFKFGTSGEFGSVILLLSNKGIQLVGSQCLNARLNDP